MSSETKRDVFEEFADKWAGLDDERYKQYLKQYDAALPDDLPVIPKVVSEYIKWGKTFDIPMYMMFSFKFVRSQGFSKLTDEVEDWIINNSDTFARAWLDGYVIEEDND